MKRLIFSFMVIFGLVLFIEGCDFLEDSYTITVYYYDMSGLLKLEPEKLREYLGNLGNLSIDDIYYDIFFDGSFQFRLALGESAVIKAESGMHIIEKAQEGWVYGGEKFDLQEDMEWDASSHTSLACWYYKKEYDR